MPLPISLLSGIPTHVSRHGPGCIGHSGRKGERTIGLPADDANESIFQNQRLSFWITSQRIFYVPSHPPLLFHCVIVGKIPWLNVLHLYLVFFSSVILYHLTAHVIGLVVPRPRAASWVSRISVLGLYVFLPGLGQVEYLSFPFLPYYPLILERSFPIFSLLGKQTLADLRQKRLISGRMYPSLTLRFLPPHSLSLCKVGLYTYPFSYRLP